MRPAPALVRLAELNLSFSHLRTMHLLFPDKSLQMKELAERLCMTPPSVTALTRRLVESGVGQLLVGREDHEQRERHHGTLEHASDKYGNAAPCQPRAECGEEPSDREAGLHHGAAAVTRTPLSHRWRRARCNARGMFDEVDVEGGAREQTGTERRDQLEDHRAVLGGQHVWSL